MNIFNILFTLFLIYFIYSCYQKIKKIHPKQLSGPFALPILGNLHQLGKLPHHILTDFHKVYGPIYRLFFGDIYTVVVSDPSLIKQICIDNADLIGNNRPVTPIFKHVQGGRGLSTSNFEQWHKNRNILNNAMKRSSTKKIYDLLGHQANELVKSMKKFSTSGEPFEIHLYAHRYSLATMFKYLFDENIDYNEDISKSKVAEFNTLFVNIIKDLSTGNLGDFINILSPFYYWYLSLTEKNVNLIKDFLRTKYDNHLSTIDFENPRDFLDILIKEYGTKKDTKESIVSVCFDLFLAGSDTVAITMEWFTLRMCNNKDIQEKAYNELKNVAGDRNYLKLSDRASTPFFNAVIKETLRSSPGKYCFDLYCFINYY
ncbi:hypothetical protein DICPUDRAFT_159750 [Dictyostelium purpureum]|uniref:Cytochrome P450 family protein n=1 Tax=Dictyostelium purpureum TaxID=5786 RepID=F1A4W9_DICPU|nr:uncharacterized protein DICPUDRAFT_159750 [Dictyostelium purpureum]EGC28763.1 hypothetical protein DICPUDRAFT_159750 [Dictyostelium purpureum]|eukprot:XP_003294710.1 hypothetical protein DICPUDRAFT_159750 [Dictyostelium purpureum]